MPFDAFTKNAVVISIVLVMLMMVSAYFGSQKGALEGTDGLVEDMAAASAQKVPRSLVELDEKGEYVGFGIVGAISGFIIGYLWPSVFYRREAGC
jgi:uncharacterized membrane protein